MKSCSSNDLCEYKTTLKKNIFRHKKAKHVVEAVKNIQHIVPCIYCGLIFDSRSQLKQHVKIHLKPKEEDTKQNPKVLQCENCDKTFSSKSNLKKHIYVTI